MIEDDVIEVYPGAGVPMNEDEVYYDPEYSINLKFKGHGSIHSPLQVMVKMSFWMGNLMESYAEQVDVPISSIWFFFNNTRINDDDTPMALKMREFDVIDVHRVSDMSEIKEGFKFISIY